MIDIELTRLLDDRDIVVWALDAYTSMRAHDPQQAALLAERWFNDANLRHLLEAGDQYLVTNLFETFPVDRWRNLVDVVAGQWPNGPATVSVVLARYAPDRAYELFRDFLDGADHPHRYRMAGILDTLEHLPDGQARDLFERALRLIRTLPPIESLRAVLAFAALRPAARLAPAELGPLFDDAVAGRDDEVAHVVDRVASALFGSDLLTTLMRDRRAGETEQPLTGFAHLFTPAAPLAEAEAVIRVDDPLPAALALLERHPAADALAVLVAGSERLREAPRAAERAALTLAAVLHTCRVQQAPTFDTLEAAIAALAVDVLELPFFHEVLAGLRTQPQEPVAERLIGLLDEYRHTYVAVHVAEAMGELRWPTFISALVAATAQDRRDFLHEAARDALTRCGEPAQRYLIDHWARLDTSQCIYGVSVVAAVGGVRAADFAIERMADLFKVDLEQWTKLALAYPDPRLIERLRPHLPRHQGLIDDVFHLLCTLLGRDEPELPQVERRVRAVAERRAQQTAAFDAGDFSRDAVDLDLLCPLCGDVNTYLVHRVVMSAEAAEPKLIAEEIPCASCGEQVDFEFTAMATLQLTAQLVALIGAAQAGGTVKSVIELRTAEFEGRRVSVPFAYTQLQKRAERHPDDARNWLRLGNLQQHLGRPQRALACYEKAHCADANAVGAVLFLADHYACQGDEAKAFDLLHGALAHRGRWAFHGAPRTMATQFANFYNRLRTELGLDHLPTVHPSALVPDKVGRNDPCPCGSGKKYKKCCAG